MLTLRVFVLLLGIASTAFLTGCGEELWSPCCDCECEQTCPAQGSSLTSSEEMECWESCENVCMFFGCGHVVDVAACDLEFEGG